VDVQIANAVTYLAQKLLVLRDRKAGKQGKDVLYIHDTLLHFSEALDELQAIWERVLPQLHPSTVRKLHARRVELFAVVTDLTRQAAIIAAATSRPNPPPADRLAAACRSGLDQIFG